MNEKTFTQSQEGKASVALRYPSFVSVFDPYRCLFVFLDQMAEKKILTSPVKHFPACIYLF